MKIKNLTSWAGANFSYRPGELIELPDKTAKARIEAGLAESIQQEKPVKKK